MNIKLKQTKFWNFLESFVACLTNFPSKKRMLPDLEKPIMWAAHWGLCVIAPHCLILWFCCAYCTIWCFWVCLLKASDCCLKSCTKVVIMSCPEIFKIEKDNNSQSCCSGVSLHFSLSFGSPRTVHPIQVISILQRRPAKAKANRERVLIRHMESRAYGALPPLWGHYWTVRGSILELPHMFAIQISINV